MSERKYTTRVCSKCGRTIGSLGYASHLSSHASHNRIYTAAEVASTLTDFAAKLKRTNILAGLPVEATTVVFPADIDRLLAEFKEGLK